MGNFNRGGSFGGNRGGGNRFGGGRDSGRPFRREDRGPVSMTKTVCDECKKPCEVPFRPTAGKPVYCNDCFRGQNAGGDRPRRDFNDRPQQAPKPSFAGNEGGSDVVKKQLELLNSKMDKLIFSIESLTQAKPIPKPVQKVEVVKSMTVSLPKKEVKKVAAKKVAKKGKK